jgi:hypothetical protein
MKNDWKQIFSFGEVKNDTTPNLQDPANPLPLVDIKKVVRTIGAGD